MRGKYIFYCTGCQLLLKNQNPCYLIYLIKPMSKYFFQMYELRWSGYEWIITDLKDSSWFPTMYLQNKFREIKINFTR